MKLHQRFLAIAIFAISPVVINAATIYVTETGAGSMNGTSWANAYPGSSLQIAINSATVGDQVWVAAGIYFTTSGTDRTISFNMRNGVAIFGSFVGTETTLSQRNITCGPNSNLSGDIGIAANTDNSYKVVSNSLLPDSSAILDGFVISGGYDERPASSSVGLGGGIYNDGSNGGYCNPMIRNCVIRNNQAEFGAGVFNNGYNSGGCYPTFENCAFVYNYATGGGGGMDNFGLLNGNANPTLINCLIANNIADDAAGGMYCWGGSNGSAFAGLTNVTMVNNTVTSGNGGGIVADNSNNGGGVGGNSGFAGAYLYNTILWDNTANIGPQFRIYGTGTVTANYSDVDTINQSGTNSLSAGGTNNIFTDPLFVNAGTPIGIDNCWMTDDDGYQLQTTSLCINTGLLSTSTPFDLAFNTRVHGPQVDMGAYETIYSTAGIEDEDKLFVQIYPNPVITTVNIISSISAKGELYNYLGEKVTEIEIHAGDNQIDISYLNAGVYFLYIKGNSYSYKVIKL